MANNEMGTDASTRSHLYKLSLLSLSPLLPVTTGPLHNPGKAHALPKRLKKLFRMPLHSYFIWTPKILDLEFWLDPEAYDEEVVQQFCN